MLPSSIQWELLIQSARNDLIPQEEPLVCRELQAENCWKDTLRELLSFRTCDLLILHLQLPIYSQISKKKKVTVVSLNSKIVHGSYVRRQLIHHMLSLSLLSDLCSCSGSAFMFAISF